jgi:hypothetical protein
LEKALDIFLKFVPIFAVLVSLYKIVKSFDDIRKDVREQKIESRFIFRALFASLNGLEQLGANGEVTKTRKSLEEYLIDKE